MERRFWYAISRQFVFEYSYRSITTEQSISNLYLNIQYDRSLYIRTWFIRIN